MKIKEIQTEPAFKPFKIEIEIETADDILWLYGISNDTQSRTKQNLEDMGVTLKLSEYNDDFQMRFYNAMKDLYERKILQNS